MKAGNLLPLETCPHCGVAHPHMPAVMRHVTSAHNGSNTRQWCIYACSSCGGMTMTATPTLPSGADVAQLWPASKAVSESVPARAREYLTQAYGCRNAPSGAIMLAASAVDSMLKEKGYSEGNLFGRIQRAANDHLLTEEMSAWAHEIRLDANDQRHADELAALPTKDDAERVLQFTSALAEFLYVLPAAIKRGRFPVSSPSRV